MSAAPSRATAEQPRAQDRGSTDGVDRVYHDYSAEGDASSLELNPALLSDMRGVDFTLLGYRTVSRFTRGSGFGGFFGWGLPFGLATSFGVQVMAPRLSIDVADFDEDTNPSATKISFGMAGRAGEAAAFGIGIHGIRTGGRWLQRPDLDIGTVFRFVNYGALGVTARLSPLDLTTDIFPAAVSLTGELSVRPLGTHHLELAGGVTQQLASGEVAQTVEGRGVEGLYPRGRVALRYQGLALKGEVEQVPASVLDPVNFQRLRGEKALRGSVSIEVAWDFARAGVGIHSGVSEGLDGYGLMARISSRRQGRAFWPRRVDAERIDVSEVKGDRELVALLQRLERARKAGKRTVLIIDARGSRLGWASLHEIRQALVRVRNAGGHVFAYVEHASLKDYYLATAAEKLYIHPAGGLSIFGMSSTSIYLRGALDKVGVKAEVIKVDEYKSASERFTNTEPSRYDREQRTELLHDIYAQIV
ncbi:MAG: S49 family peptidase, partial [Nannocystaceae bacterium]|nr:S49 family peptidase [Nannocystaceae bacterium]